MDDLKSEEEDMAKKKTKAPKKKIEKVVDLRKLPKDKRPKPTTGQSADERDLPFASLSDAEKMVVRALNGKGNDRRLDRSIEFIAELFDGKNSKLQARNALRRLVACGWVEWVARGVYKISEKGRKRLDRI